jgi:hypothetical protein
MQIKIPTNENPVLSQVNNSSILGTIVDSFNLDLTTDEGKIRTTKTLLSKKSSSVVPGDFGGTQNGGVGAIATLSSQIWMVSGDALWRGGNSPSDTISIDTSINTPVVYYQDSDLKGYNSTLYAVSQTDIYKYTPGTVTWSSVHTFSTSGQAHLFETHSEYLYFTFDEYKVGRINSAGTVSTTGTGTLNPNLPGFSISFIKSDGNKLWIGYMNTSGGKNETTLIVTWDGSTENVISSKYKIETRGILAGCIVDGVPHVVDCNGRLLSFNGSFFKEVDSFPLKSYEYLYGFGAKFNQRAIHPNGMVYDATNKEILINVSNVKIFGASPTFYSFPGGVWAYSAKSGLTHKYAPSLQPISDSGTTNLIEYGQYNTMLAGAIVCLGLRPDTGEKGRVLFGTTIAVGSSININTTSCIATLCTDDTANTAQNFAYFVTSEIHSSKVIDTWQQVYALYQQFTSVTDKIIVKYRTENNTKTTANVTWSDIDRITTTTDVSSYVVGDEVQFIQGTGSGRSFHITSIVNNSGTYTIIFDDSMSSGVIGLTAVGVFDKWIKLGEVNQSDSFQQWKEFLVNIKNVSPFIKIKVCMQFTGENQMYGILVKSNSEIK